MSKQGEIRVARGNDSYSTYGGTRKAITTLDFGQLTPFMADEVLERDKWQFRFNTRLDIAPLAVRTFNNIYLHQSSFFVPYTQLDSEFSNIRSLKKTHFAQSVGKMLSFCYADMINAIVGGTGLTQCGGTQSSGNPFQVTFKVDSTKDKGLFDWALTDASLTSNTGYSVQAKGLAQILPVGEENNHAMLKAKLLNDYPGADIILCYRFVESSSTYTFITLPLYYTKKGQMLRKVFDGLGYKMPLCFASMDKGNFPSNGSGVYIPVKFESMANKGTPSPTGSVIRTKASAYPLLAYLRVVADYFVMASVQDEEPISEFLSHVYNRDSNFYQTEGDYVGTLSASTILEALLMVSLQLHSDDVTRATRNFYDFAQPFAGAGSAGKDTLVLQGVVSPKYINSLPLDSIDNKTDLRGLGSTTLTTMNSNLGLSTQTISRDNIKMLDVAHRYLLTSKYAGGKLARRLRLLFGLTDPIEDAKHSIRIMENVVPIQVNGSIIQSNTYNGSDVDDDAGTKIGIATGGSTKTFSFFNDKGYGLGLSLNWLSVQTIYANRTPRYIQKTVPELLYNGMYDGQGFQQTISQMEVNTDMYDPSLNYAFGAEPLYEDYRKLSIDYFSGDILRLSGMKSYLVPRDFRNILNQKELFAELSSVRSVRQATDEFGDLWISKDGSDPVVCCVDVSVLATRNIQDSVHALALPAGSENLSVNNNMA